MEISDEGLDFICNHEGLRTKVYDDVAGHPTIGYGHLLTPDELRSGVYDHGITEERARELLRHDVGIASRAVDNLVKVSLTQNQHDALVSYTYNLGSKNLEKSTLLKKLNEGDYDAVPDELAKWDKAKDPKTGQLVSSKGLAQRRRDEGELWSNPSVPAAKVSKTQQATPSAAATNQKRAAAAAGRVQDPFLCEKHGANGKMTSGSPNVLINNLRALRDADIGIHPTTTVVARGQAPHILINGKIAFRVGNPVFHEDVESGKLIQGSPNVVYGNQDRVLKKKPPKSVLRPESDWLVVCEHEFDNRQRCAKPIDSVFEIVATKDKDIDKVTVLDRIKPGPSPQKITVVTGNSTQEVSAAGKQGDGFTPYTFDCKYVEPPGFSLLSTEFWTGGTHYEVRGLARTLEIIHRSPHQWKLKISMPPMRRIKQGAMLESAKMAQQSPSLIVGASEKKKTFKYEETGWKPRGGTQTETKQSLTFVDSQSFAVTPVSVQAAVAHSVEFEAEQKTEKKRIEAIEISRDNQSIEFKELNAFLVIVKLAMAIFEMIRTIQDTVPRIGWYFDADVQLMQGAFVLEWGWREYKDHRAYLWISAGIDISLINVSLELGFGLSVAGFKAQIFASISGELKIGVNAERTGPEAAAKLKIGFDHTITGALGARVEAGNVVNVTASVESALTFKGALNIDTKFGPSIDGSVTWSGIAGKVEISVGEGGSVGRKVFKRTFIKEQDLGSFQWPMDEPYNPENTTRERIQSILVDKLTEGFDIRVFTPSNHWYSSDEHWDIDRVAKKLAEKIDARSDIRRDAKSIEGLAHDIRQRMNELGDRWGRDWIESWRFEAFVNTELDAIMTATYVDPCKVLVQSVKGQS